MSAARSAGTNVEDATVVQEPILYRPGSPTDQVIDWQRRVDTRSDPWTVRITTRIPGKPSPLPDLGEGEGHYPTSAAFTRSRQVSSSESGPRS